MDICTLFTRHQNKMQKLTELQTKVTFICTILHPQTIQIQISGGGLLKGHFTTHQNSVYSPWLNPTQPVKTTVSHLQWSFERHRHLPRTVYLDNVKMHYGKCRIQHFWSMSHIKGLKVKIFRPLLLLIVFALLCL